MSQKSNDSARTQRQILKVKQSHGSHKIRETSSPSKRRRVLQTVVTTTSTVTSASSRTKNTKGEMATSTLKAAESVFAIDYSPRSKFLRKLKQNGRIVKKSPRQSMTSSPSIYVHKTSVPCHKRSSLTRKTKDVGTNPASSRSSSISNLRNQRITSSSAHKTRNKGTDPPSFRSSPRFKDVGTDPPSFTENKTSEKTSSVSTSTAPDLPNTYSCGQMNTGQSAHTSHPCKCQQIDIDVLLDLQTNERQGKETMDCPQQAMQELRNFRLEHWFDCHADPKQIPVLPNHSCSHQYILNDRLLPQPIKSNVQGQSICNKCGLPAFAASKNAKHQIILGNHNKKVKFDIPNPYNSEPILKSTVESRNKISIPSAPTLSYIPHLPQRHSKPLTKATKPEIQNSKKIVHTINCKRCMPRI